jgi:hypothetical protein
MLRQLFGLSEDIARYVAEVHRVWKLKYQKNFRAHDVHGLVANQKFVAPHLILFGHKVS